MNFQKKSTLFVVLTITLVILSSAGVEASRVLSEDFAGGSHLQTYSSSVYEKAKFTMACWLERLASGPSPRGPGH
ncbi:Transmembrane protein [Trema orientale]|uniref:Transmembrane protein n=1 Tax=Trema orientale TaxID=63057 RepID=A0A2P5FW41_TREOI|nr:Transmembrane protein [Trema orientale]